MRIDILTVLPEMLESPLSCSILKRAQDKGLAQIVVHTCATTPPTNTGKSTTTHSAAKPAW